MKTENTSKKFHVGWLFGQKPDFIEIQEAKGNKELVESCQLPRECNSPSEITDCAEQTERWA